MSHAQSQIQKQPQCDSLQDAWAVHNNIIVLLLNDYFTLLIHTDLVAFYYNSFTIYHNIFENKAVMLVLLIFSSLFIS